jgi:hypothetical protein
LENLGKDSKIILKCILKREDGRMWNALTWLSIQTIGELQ